MDESPKIPGSRKKKNLFRQHDVHVFFTREEKDLLDARVKKAGVGLAYFIRNLALTGKLKPRLTEEDRPIFRDLIAMANDLNQLVEMARKEGMPVAVLHFERYRNKIDELINKIEHA